MIHATHRFHGRGSLRFVYQHGKTVRGPQLALKYVRNSRRRTYRVAVVVSRKVHKSAVVRNRIRRRIYEIVRAEFGQITEPYDLVFTVFSDQLATVGQPELTAQIHARLQAARLISGPTTPGHGIVEQKENQT